MTITPEEVARLAAAATPGPWFATKSNYVKQSGMDKLRTIADVRYKNGWHDAAFIAAAHDMADLIARMDEALKAADALAFLVNDPLCDDCCASANPQITLGLQRIRQDALAAFTSAREKLK